MKCVILTAGSGGREREREDTSGFTAGWGLG